MYEGGGDLTTMAEDKKFALAQAARFAGLSGFPQEPEARGEIAMALVSFPTREDTMAFVGEWLAREIHCPKPADIRRLAFHLRELAEQEERRKPICPDCGNVGYISESRMIQAIAGMNRAEYEFAKPCPRGCKPSKHVKGEWGTPLDLCQECREWGSFGWVWKDGKYQHCKNFELHRHDVSDYLLEVMTAQRKKGGNISAPELLVAAVNAGTSGQHKTEKTL
jgi:hypothetical protein